jgi:amidase
MVDLELFKKMMPRCIVRRQGGRHAAAVALLFNIGALERTVPGGLMEAPPNEEIWFDATAQAEAIRRREVSAQELVQAYLARIDRVNPLIRAFVAVDAEGAIAAAEAVDRRRLVRPEEVQAYEGVTISIKDVIDVEGLPTTQSCELLAENIAASDGPLVRRLRQAGFIPIGKTNVPEFCSDMTTSRLNGTSRNPWDLTRTPGGSSGGAAAALSGGLCAVSHGTDGAGSVRVPASYCGLVGLKPTRGLISFGPDEGNPYFGTTTDAPLTRSVRDAAALLDAMAPIGGWTPGRARPFAEEIGIDPGHVRIGVCTSFPVGDLDPDCAAATEETGRLLEKLGHQVDYVVPAWETILLASLLPATGPSPADLIPLDQIDRVEPRNRETITRGATITLLEHSHLVESARSASREFLRLWDDIDVLVTPTCGVLPPPVEWALWDDDGQAHRARFATFPNFAQPFNVSGQPAFTLPLGWSSQGLPVGVQLAARKLEEGLLFRLSGQLEQARPWADRTVSAGKALR